MRKYLPIYCVLMLAACSRGGGTGGSNKEPDNATTKKTDSLRPNLESDTKIVSSSSDGVLVELNRPAATYYGITLKTTFTDLIKTTKAELGILLAQIKNHGGTISGPMAYIFKSVPNKNEIEVFLGIPVLKKMEYVEKGEFLEIAAGRYYKMLANSVPGETLNQHLKMQKILSEKNIKINLPILEVFSQNYNENMTPESRAALYYPTK
jgi:hypothetical protein